MTKTKKRKKINGKFYTLHATYGHISAAQQRQRVLKADGFNARIIPRTRTMGKKMKAITGFHVYKRKKK